jgi:hypothetical protein
VTGTLGSARRSAFCDTEPLIGATGAAALKLEANKIAETESRATERVIWSAEARVELLGRFFILFFLVRAAVSTEKPHKHVGLFCAGARTSVKNLF